MRRYSGAAFSETAARSTNLSKAPASVEVDGRFLEEGLIHKTRKGVTVRSKSEVIIADLLYSKDIEFEYEQPVVAADGTWRSPDFTIVDDTTGTTIYWEHLGMLQRPSYRRKWEAKLAWYRANGPAKGTPQRCETSTTASSASSTTACRPASSTTKTVPSPPLPRQHRSPPQPPPLDHRSGSGVSTPNLSRWASM